MATNRTLGRHNIQVRIQRLATAVLAISAALPLNGQDKSATERIDTQREIYPQERIHSVTDRDMYCGGDTVWMRVFVTDAASLAGTSMSKYAYVELISPFNSVEERVKLINRDGIFSGYLPLAEDIYEGDYTLAAYTAFAENTGKDYFFRKPLRILAPHSSKYAIDAEFTPEGEGVVNGQFKLRPLHGGKPNYNLMSWTMPDGKSLDMPDASKGFSRKFSRQRGEDVVLVRFGDYFKYIPVEYPVETTDLRFYPEGGWLIAGEPCKIAFKATDENGRGVQVAGTVRDDSGAEVAKFATSHNGMGILSIVPEEGRTYTAEYIGPDGARRTSEMGTPMPGAAALRYGSSGSRSFFSVAGGKGMDLELVLACRGTGVLAAGISPDTPLTLEKSELPTGLYQAMLVSKGDSAVVSERLFFIGADRPFGKTASLSTDSTTITLKTPKGFGNADCCVRITDRVTAWTDRSADIRTQLLLQSELRGRIENPAAYFETGNKETERNLDMLMMVNGWSRYNLPDAILGKYAEPQIPLEIGQEISGQVRSRWRNKPLEGVMVCAISPKADFGTYADTDENGEFHLNGFDLPENTPFIFKAMNEKGGSEGNFDIYEDRFPDTDRLTATDMKITDNDIDGFFKGSKWIMLDEITVQAFNQAQDDIYSAISDYSKSTGDFKRLGITSIGQALKGIGGMVNVSGRLFWRSSPVVYYIDGTLYDPYGSMNSFGASRYTKTLKSYMARSSNYSQPGVSGFGSDTDTPMLVEVESVVPFNAIERIDYIRPEHSLIFSETAGLGAVVITTKQGDKKNWSRQFELKDFIPLGYQEYKEYASPLLSSETDAYDLQTSPTLLWLPSVKFGESGKDITLKIPATEGTIYEFLPLPPHRHT